MFGKKLQINKLQGDTILDLGCGNGNIISLLKKERDAFYYGLDISKNMIEEAKKRCGEDVDENAGFKVYDWKKINYRTFIFNAKKN